MKIAISAGCMVLASTLAHAQTEPQSGIKLYDKGITGEASVSGNVSTGNTETAEAGLAVKLGYEMGLWRHALVASYDFGTASGEKTKDRAYADYQGDRLINERVFTFGRLSYEQDRFSGYDYRAVVAAGFGVDILRGDARSWNVRGGPGVQFSTTREVIDPVTGLVTPSEDETTAALSLGSRFMMKFNDYVSLTNDSDATIGNESTKLLNSLGVTSELAAGFALRLSMDVAHNTSPPDEATKKTDTISRASLVYKFGD